MSNRFGFGMVEQRYNNSGVAPGFYANIISIKGATKKSVSQVAVSNIIVDGTTWPTTPVVGRLVIITGAGTLDETAFYEPLFAPSAGFPDRLVDFSLLFDVTYLGQGHHFFDFSTPLVTNDNLFILATPVYTSTVTPGSLGIQSCVQRLYAQGKEWTEGQENYLQKGSWR